MDSHLFSVFYNPKNKKLNYYSKAHTAFVFYKEFKINLNTGEKSKSSIDEIIQLLANNKVSDKISGGVVWHLFYELGLYCVEHQELISEHKPIAIYLVYEDKKELNESQFDLENLNILNLEVTEYPQAKKYNEKFKKVYKHLIDGDCYQVNLTQPFYFKFSPIITVNDFFKPIIENKKSLGEYFHLTYIDSLAKLFLSNSPECLFELEITKDEYKVISKPIKGTLKVSKEKTQDESWKILSESKKDEGELFMIADLIRNDLAKINFTKAVITHKKCPLIVPGLMHQYSKIETVVSKETNLAQVVLALFPGGSITGAPKKRVMEIIKEIESYNRGFYCGSTILLDEEYKKASINIRSAEVDFSQMELFYGAGGAITLLSEEKDEFDETYSKMESFLQFLKVENINKG